mgnify:CR=1 FL=1
MKQYRLNIDGKEVLGVPGQTILEVARENDISIPTLCYDERTTIYGACGLCVVEVEGNPKLVKACATEIAPNMVVRTKTKRVLESRKTNLELLLSNHVGDCRPPCVLNCPAGTDCQGYVGLIANGRFEEAIALIRERIPLPGSIGRVCPHPCEDNCRRALVDQPVAIAWLKRFAADWDQSGEDPFLPEIAPETGRSVAIIGGGPYGLSAAYFLRQMGHAVTIFEAMPKLGGMLRYGIPEYRLPKSVVDEEVATIARMGVTLRPNTRVGKDISFETLRETYDAVLVGVGAWVSTGTGCPGEELPGVVGGIDFLRHVVRNEPIALGKRVAIVGGGPGGLSAAYYLALMGHKVTVYERQSQLGGMMRYGIPSYRFPRELLDQEIASILSLGIEVHTGVNVGTDCSFDELKKQYDCIYLSIGAHTDKKTGIEGENSKGVVSAVEMLRRIGDNEMPDFTGQNVVVIGGGNVAMDVTRSSIRLGAKKVTCVYRRRQEDMTALPEEVEGAVAEGAELLTLQAPLRIEADKDGKVTALWTQPQVIGEADKQGRPRPGAAAVEEKRIPADTIIVAIGQGIETHGLEQSGIRIQRGGTVLADSSTSLPELEGVFAGGDCVTGPATVIKAIAAGKAAAANIDEYLGFHHEIVSEVQVPVPGYADLRSRGRITSSEREASERKKDFQCIECGMTCEEALKESSRCLRCDHFGYGIFKGGRVEKW